MKKQSPRAVIYLRQASGEESCPSVEKQELACWKTAAQEGFSIFGKAFVDLDRSGAAYPAGAEAFSKSDRAWLAYLESAPGANAKEHPYREGLAQALEALAEADYLLVYDATRIAMPPRNSYLATYIVQELEAKGANLFTAREGMLAEEELSAYHWKVEHRQNAAIGRKKKMDKGASWGSETLGYKWIDRQKTAVNEGEAKVVKRIFNDALTISFYRIARNLNAEMVPGKRKKEHKRWTIGDIRRILKNPSYIGRRLNSMGKFVESAVFREPLVDVRLFNSVQAMLKANARTGRKGKRQHYTTGMVFCGNCGNKKMTYAGSGKFNAHVCKHGKPGSPNSTLSILEHVSFQSLNKIPERPTLLGLAECLYPLCCLAPAKRLKDMAAQKSKSDERLKITGELDRIKELARVSAAKWAAGNALEEPFELLARECARRTIDQKSKLAKLGTDMDVVPLEAINAQELLARIIRGELTPRELSEMLHSVIKNIIVGGDKIRLILYDDKHLDIARLRYRKTKSCPAWTLRCEPAIAPGRSGAAKPVIRYFYSSWYESPQWRLDPRSGMKTPVCDGQESLLLENDHIKILSVGSNQSAS